jgi:palmitoyltransferase
LEPGRLPSTVDPDTVQEADRAKKLPQRPVRISAWKLAKLDSSEAFKAAAKARASSSVLRPIGSRYNLYDAGKLSSSNVSGRSSPISTDQGFQNKNDRAVVTGLSPSRTNSYTASNASNASRDDIESCRQSRGNFSSANVSNLAASPLQQQTSNRDHFNPIYQTSTEQPPWTARQIELNGNPLRENVAQIPMRRNLGVAENMRTAVYWDPEAGRFVSSSRGAGSSSQVRRTELLYKDQSIFFGGPLVNELLSRGTRTGTSLAPSQDRGSTSSHYQQGRSQRGDQLHVFVPSDSQQNQYSSRPPSSTKMRE